MLARYARIRAGERLTTRFVASGALYYVIAGSGETVQGADAIAWDEGDAFCLPGKGEATHIAGGGDCLLYVVTNEPLLAFERLEPPRLGRAPIEAAHYPADEIQRQLDGSTGSPPPPRCPASPSASAPPGWTRTTWRCRPSRSR